MAENSELHEGAMVQCMIGSKRIDGVGHIVGPSKHEPTKANGRYDVRMMAGGEIQSWHRDRLVVVNPDPLKPSPKTVKAAEYRTRIGNTPDCEDCGQPDGPDHECKQIEEAARAEGGPFASDFSTTDERQAKQEASAKPFAPFGWEPAPQWAKDAKDADKTIR